MLTVDKLYIYLNIFITYILDFRMIIFLLYKYIHILIKSNVLRMLRRIELYRLHAWNIYSKTVKKFIILYTKKFVQYLNQ